MLTFIDITMYLAKTAPAASPAYWHEPAVRDLRSGNVLSLAGRHAS